MLSLPARPRCRFASMRLNAAAARAMSSVLIVGIPSHFFSQRCNDALSSLFVVGVGSAVIVGHLGVAAVAVDGGANVGREVAAHLLLSAV